MLLLEIKYLLSYIYLGYWEMNLKHGVEIAEGNGCA